MLIIGLILLNICQQFFAQANRQVKFVFKGNKIFSSAELLNVLEKCRKDYQKKGATNDDRIIEDCLRKPVRAYMFDKGYSTAKIGDLKKEQAGKDLEITIPVIEGKQYRLGEISVEGEQTFSEEEILKSFPMKKGEIVNASLMNKWFSFLEDLYANKGFPQFSCEPEPNFIDGIVNIKFIIDEGRFFKVGRINFVIDTNLRSNYFRRYLTFDEGEVFSKQKLRETIEKINRLNKFQQIDFDKDIEIRSDNEAPSVNLTINIKKKEQ